MIGLTAIVVTCVTAALTVPLIKTLKGQFSSEELLIVRSLFGFVGALIISRDAIRYDRKTIEAGIIVGLSSIAFYRAVQVWDVNPCMVIMAGLPLVNVAIAVYEGRKVSALVIFSVFCLIAGVTIALEPWKQAMNWTGLWYMLACNIIGGIGFELWARLPEKVSVSDKCFWLSVPLIFMSLVVMFLTHQCPDMGKYLVPHTALVVAFFGIIGGVVYMYGTIVPFALIEVQTVCVLLQGTTPAAIIGAYFMAGESLSSRQWVGVIVAIIGTAILSVWTAKTGKDQKVVLAESQPFE